MIRIDTTIEPRTVEIDDREYTIAPRTIEVCDRLLDAEKAHIGKPAYRLKLAELKILLGDAAWRELFVSRDKENVDRIDRIYKAVSQAFTATEEELNALDTERKAQQLAAALAPVNEFMKNVRALNAAEGKKENNIREIRRGQAAL